MKIITIAVALLSVMGPPHVVDGLPQSNPFDNGSVDNNSKKPEEIAAFWTADRRKNTVSRDIGITPNGTALVRGVDGTMEPFMGGKGPPHQERHLRGREIERNLQSVVANGDISMPIPTRLNGVGRLFFCFGNKCYSCTGNAISGNMIATAAHCAWDKKFATNVMFIPEQEGTSSSSANRDCNDDLHGCWFPSHAVIHDNYKTSWWLNDFAVYVINPSDSSSHLSSSGSDNRPMSDFICPFDVDFDQETLVSGSGFGTSYGYPGYSSPDMRFCQDVVDYPTPQPHGDDCLFLGSCTMGGGSSGGGWAPYDSFELFATNSFGYCDNSDCSTMLDGMGATRCFGQDHICQCVLNRAKVTTSNTVVTQTGCSLSPHTNDLGAMQGCAQEPISSGCNDGTCATNMYCLNPGDTGTCEYCDLSCATCNVLSNMCTSCATNKYLDGDSCSDCPLSCLDCDADGCISCPEGFEIDGDNTCQPAATTSPTGDTCNVGPCTSDTDCPNCARGCKGGGPNGKKCKA